MKTTITLSEREKNHLRDTIDILNEYSRIYSASVKGKTGMFHDTAASAVNMIESILKEGV